MRVNDNGLDRDMTAEEVETFKISIKAAQNEEKIKAKELADRQALKEATIAKLGLTADEVAALLS
jgi:hypothetical protein